MFELYISVSIFILLAKEELESSPVKATGEEIFGHFHKL